MLHTTNKTLLSGEGFATRISLAALSIAMVSVLSITTFQTARADNNANTTNDATGASRPDGSAPGAKRTEKLIATMQSHSATSDESTKDKDLTRDNEQNSSKDAGSNQNEARSYFEQERTSRKRKYAHSSSTVQIDAPQAVVWKVLIDFEHYPQLFKRIDTCHITKREHGLLYAETYLKPQMFVKKLCQHTVTDISQGPNYLQWKMLDGNFKSVVGSWTLSTTRDKKGKPVCEAEYTLEADPGPVIPSPLVSFLLHQVEHEVVTSFKKGCEETYARDGDKQSNASAPATSSSSLKVSAAKAAGKG